MNRMDAAQVSDTTGDEKCTNARFIKNKNTLTWLINHQLKKCRQCLPGIAAKFESVWMQQFSKK